MSQYAVKVNHVSKKFLLPHQRSTTLKSFILNPFKRFENEKQMALNDVSFEIKKGDFFGIVGKNGSGKSTLLKCMAGVYTPDSGEISVEGNLVPFIELGVGFNPELSGRDNVYLNGALLGFSRKKMEGMYDEIVEFAELEKFMDQKLKNYSSGMQVRLAFSIAIRAEGDILLLDEVLAVGDEAFQKKCINVFEEYKASDKTIILVTHSMSVVEKYCDRAVLLDDGRLIDTGDPRKIAGKYSVENNERYSQHKKKADAKKHAETENVEKKYGIKYSVSGKSGKPTGEFEFGETLDLSVSWESKEIKNIGIALVKNTGEYIFGTNTIVDGVVISKNNTKYSLKLNLNEGGYKFVIGFFGKTPSEKIHFSEKELDFLVKPHNQGWQGTTKLTHEWN